MTCDNCGYEFNPIATRWRCTACGLKAYCCG
jgi:rubredoxin